MRTIYMNGRFYTFDENIPQAEAVVVKDGKIIAIGTSEDLLRNWKDEKTLVIDLEGKAVTPGLTDSHLHLSGIASQFLHVNVSGITSKYEMLQIIQKRTEDMQPGEWLVGRGWDENLFTDGGIPSIEELDAIIPENPLFMSRVCGHAFLVNSKALEVCGYHSKTAVPEGGTVVLDEATNKPTGLLLEGASQFITKHIPNPSYNDWKRALRKAIQFVLQKGITSVHTNDPRFLGGLEQTWRLYDQLIHKENLGLRCNLLIDHEFIDDLQEKGMYAGYGTSSLQIGALKVFSDGALGRRTALLSEPYTDDPEEYGDAMLSQKQLRRIVMEARKLHMPLAIHTIGDQALENVLNVLDEFPEVAYRDRLIHVQVLRKDLIDRLKDGNRMADIQPRFLAGDFPWVQNRLGEDRLKLAYAWKTLISSGVICAAGSDCPVEPLDPLLGIHAAVMRKLPHEHHEGYNPSEKLTMYEAFQLFTKMGAYPTNEETYKGTLSIGKFADMTVYTQDPFRLKDLDELLDIEIDMTIIGGEIKYQRD